MLKFIYLIFIFCSLCFPAYAYLDPGLGTFIIQSIIGFAAVALGTISLFWQRVKTALSKIVNLFKNKSVDKK